MNQKGEIHFLDSSFPYNNFLLVLNRQTLNKYLPNQSRGLNLRLILVHKNYIAEPPLVFFLNLVCFPQLLFHLTVFSVPKPKYHLFDINSIFQFYLNFNSPVFRFTYASKLSLVTPNLSFNNRKKSSSVVPYFKDSINPLTPSFS